MWTLRWTGLSLAMLCLLSAGPADAVAPTVISSCPATINASGYYAVESELDATGDCITIKAANVTLAIYATMSGNNTGTGIAIAKGATGVAIRSHGAFVRFFQNGIVDQGGGAFIGGLNVENNAGTGLLLAGTSSAPTMVDNVEASNNEIGIHVTSPAGARMNSLQMYYNTDRGLWLDRTSHNTVAIGFTAYQSGKQVEIDSSDNTVGTCELDYGTYGIIIARGAGNNLVADCNYDTGAGASVLDAIDHNHTCGTNAWAANTLPTGKPGCARRVFPLSTKVLAACQSIETGGFYYVHKNLKASGDCFVVDAPNVMLFGDFRTVTGNRTGTGIHVTSAATGFRGGGLTFRRFAIGQEFEANNALFEGGSALDNQDTGVLVSGASGVTLGQSDGNDNRRFGYHLLNASSTMIHNFSAFSNGAYGVFVQDSNANLFDQFSAGGSGANGIAGLYIGCSTKGPTGACSSQPSLRNVIGSGSASSNTKYGFVIDAHSDQTLVANTSSGGNGIDDAYDANTNCANNVWFLDTFGTSNNPGCMNQQ